MDLVPSDDLVGVQRRTEVAVVAGDPAAVEVGHDAIHVDAQAQALRRFGEPFAIGYRIGSAMPGVPNSRSWVAMA